MFKDIPDFRCKCRVTDVKLKADTSTRSELTRHETRPKPKPTQQFSCH